MLLPSNDNSMIEMKKDILGAINIEPLPTVTEGASYIDLDVESEGQKKTKIDAV